MEFRRPKKTLLQRALREAERTISGALFLHIPVNEAAQKADLRARFVAGVCAILIARKHLTMLQAEKQLSPNQLEILNNLPANEVPAPEILWGTWLQGPAAELKSQLLSWVELGAHYVAGRLRQEPEPPTVDWGRREQELRGLLSSYEGEARVDLSSAKLTVKGSRGVEAESSFEVVGTFLAQKQEYVAGWADSAIEPASRPLPVFGCASRLFRQDLTGARSEAHRAAWLGRVSYLLEYSANGKLYFLGLDKPKAIGLQSTFQIEDIREEMLARLDKIHSAANNREPERLKDYLLSQGQEVRRQLPLFRGNPEGTALLERTADKLSGMGNQLKTQNLLGSSRSSLSRKEIEELQTELAELKENWLEPG